MLFSLDLSLAPLVCVYKCICFAISIHFQFVTFFVVGNGVVYGLCLCLLASAFMKLHKKGTLLMLTIFNITRRSFTAFVHTILLLVLLFNFSFPFLFLFVGAMFFLSCVLVARFSAFSLYPCHYYYYFTLKLVHLCRIDNDKVDGNKKTTWHFDEFAMEK